MGKYIGRIYKHGQSQISTTSIKKPVFNPQIIKNHPQLIQQELLSLLLLTKSKLIPFCVTKIPSIMILKMKNNDSIQSCKTSIKTYRIPATSPCA